MTTEWERGSDHVDTGAACICCGLRRPTIVMRLDGWPWLPWCKPCYQERIRLGRMERDG